MTEGEKLVWAAAYVATLHDGHMEQHAMNEAWRTVTNLRDATKSLGLGGMNNTQVNIHQMAKDMLL